YQNANDQTLHLWLNAASLASEPEQTNLDVPIRLKFRRNFALNWAVGASYQPISGLTIGASFRGKRSIRSDGTLDLDLPNFLKGIGTVEGRDFTIELNTAPITRVGVEYAIPKLFKAELAFVYEYWKAYDQIVVRPENIVVTINGMSQ